VQGNEQQIRKSERRRFRDKPKNVVCDINWIHLRFKKKHVPC